jgi:NADPH:quinone reductase-like Zn-dependent oxidoreductase
VWAQQLTGPAMFQRVEVPAPAAGDLRPGEVLVALEHGGICGSDLPYFRAGGRVVAERGRPAGAPPGFPLHEIVGRVRATRDPGVSVDDRVVGWASASNARGIPLFVEKPLGRDAGEARRIAAMIDAAGMPFATGFLLPCTGCGTCCGTGGSAT